MKKESARQRHARARAPHRETGTASSAPRKLEAREKPFNPFRAFSNLFKKRRAAGESPVAQQTSEIQVQGPPPKLELDQEVKQLIERQDDAVNKLYQLDILLRKYYGKEYKTGKKLPYTEMVPLLEKQQRAAAANLIRKIIEYAYSGKPLEDPQIKEILLDFQQLMRADALQKQVEKEAHRKRRPAEEAPRESTPLASHLQPIVPHLPPASEPFIHLPTLDMQKYRDKLNDIVAKVRRLSLPRIFARARLPAAASRTQVPRAAQKHALHLPYLTLPHVKLPRPHLPALHASMLHLNLSRLSLPTIHVPQLHLPKVTLPYINRHESHAPRRKLVSPARNQPVPPKAQAFHLPHIHLPAVHMPKVTMPHLHLPRHPFSRLRRALHLPAFHPDLYYERMKEHLEEFHPSEYIHTVTDHIPRLHPHEYYESMKETVQETWEKIHPPKPSEEELALQAEIEQEQAQEQQSTEHLQAESLKATSPEPKKQEQEPATPVPVTIKPEPLWIEYKPRHHPPGVQHHFAYEIDDLRHIRKILRQHHKPFLT